MPTALNFTSLQADLRAYLERGQPVDPTVFAQIPRLINNAEREIAQDLKILGFLNPVLSGLVAGTSVYSKPDRWRRTASMNFGAGVSANERTPIYNRSYEYCRRYWPNSNLQGPPKFYVDYDYTHWLIVPTPDAAYPWELNIWQLPALLDVTNQTNWLTDFAPTTLLYRALQECEAFLKNDARVALWKGWYDESKSGLNNQDLKRIIDRSTEREED